MTHADAAGRGARTRRRFAIPITIAAALVCAAAGVAYILFAGLPVEQAQAVTGTRGIVDQRLESVTVDITPEVLDPMIQELSASRLNAGWSRIVVHWATLEPTAPDEAGHHYNADYLARLDAVIGGLQKSGIRVIVTCADVPKWASDKALWTSPPEGVAKGYQPFYAMDISSGSNALSSFQALGKFLSSHEFGTSSANRVKYFEVWNEPNLGLCIYPQRTNKLVDYGPRVYVAMLKRFSAGVRPNGGAVIAGATAPRGTNNDYSTAPADFAKYIKKAGGASYFDAYSHHPYTPGGTLRPAPNQPPNNPKRCVTLYNLRDLLDLFPSKPFYLTEYGYSTHYSALFGLTVTKAQQAKYLTQAYSYIKRYKQVKALLWYLVRDWGPADDPYNGYGAYTGVQMYDGSLKPSWYAFAGGTRVSITAPTSAKSGVSFAITGVLSNSRTGIVATERVLLQSRKPSETTWRTLGGQATKTDGSFSFSTKQTATRIYRVIWDGVVNSPTRKVATP